MKKVVLALLLFASYGQIKDTNAENLTIEEKEIRTKSFIDSFQKDNPEYPLNPEFLGLLKAGKVDISETIISSTTLQKLSTLTWLFSIELNNCNLQNLPESFDNLAILELLGLTNNKLETLPESFKDLTNLRILFLVKNQLQNLSESFKNLGDSLQLIDLEENPVQLNGEDETLGETELQLIFGDKITLPTLK